MIAIVLQVFWIVICTLKADPAEYFSGLANLAKIIMRRNARVFNNLRSSVDLYTNFRSDYLSGSFWFNLNIGTDLRIYIPMLTMNFF